MNGVRSKKTKPSANGATSDEETGAETGNESLGEGTEEEPATRPKPRPRPRVRPANGDATDALGATNAESTAENSPARMRTYQSQSPAKSATKTPLTSPSKANGDTPRTSRKRPAPADDDFPESVPDETHRSPSGSFEDEPQILRKRIRH